MVCVKMPMLERTVTCRYGVVDILAKGGGGVVKDDASSAVWKGMGWGKGMKDVG